jgi:hypothetical protein
MFHSGSVTVSTDCTLTNLGKKAVTLSNPRILPYTAPIAQPPTADAFSPVPLPPDEVCTFSGSEPVVQILELR